MNLAEQIKNFFKQQAFLNFGTGHFFRGELDEMYMRLRNTVEFPALALEGITSEYNRKENGWWREITVAFCVFDKYDESKDYEAIDNVLKQTDKDAEKILARLLAEYEGYREAEIEYGPDPCDGTTNRLATAEFTGAQTQEVINDEQNYAGVRYIVTVECWWNE